MLETIEHGALIKNEPLLLRVLCNGSGSVISHFDEEVQWTELSFIPLRIDEVLNPFSQMYDGLILGIVVEAIGRKGKEPVQYPRGTTIYLLVRSSATMKGPYNSFKNQVNELRVMHKVRMQSAIFSPYFTPKTNDKGVYAICKWDVKPASPETEGDIYEELKELTGTDWMFDQVYPSSNSFVENMNNSARNLLEGEVQETEVLALPG